MTLDFFGAAFIVRLYITTGDTTVKDYHHRDGRAPLASIVQRLADQIRRGRKTPAEPIQIPPDIRPGTVGQLGLAYSDYACKRHEALSWLYRNRRERLTQ